MSGSNGFFDMISETFIDGIGNRLAVVLVSMAIPLLLVAGYKAYGIIRKKEVSLTLNIAYVVAGSLMVVLYYITEVILYGSIYIPIISIPMNILQFMIGIIIVNLLKPISKFMKLT
jgi:hypothetical protein